MQMSLASHGCCARLKILKQAWIFSASHIITPQGSCIHRKAINKDKPLSSGFYSYHGLDSACALVPGNLVQMSAESSSLELCRVQPRFNVFVKGSTPQDSFFSTRVGTEAPGDGRNEKIVFEN